MGRIMARCMLCKKKVDHLTEHDICEECEKQFDFSLNPPPSEDRLEKSPHKTVWRMLILGGSVVAMIVFFYLLFYGLMGNR